MYMAAFLLHPLVVLACQMSQVLGRANMIAAARERITATLLKHDDIEPASSIWRPLLHAAAVGGDFELTQSLYDEMVHHTGQSVKRSHGMPTSGIRDALRLVPWLAAAVARTAATAVD